MVVRTDVVDVAVASIQVECIFVGLECLYSDLLLSQRLSRGLSASDCIGPAKESAIFTLSEGVRIAMDFVSWKLGGQGV